MSHSFSPQGRPLLVGANHRSSSMMLRDRLFVEDTAISGDSSTAGDWQAAERILRRLFPLDEAPDGNGGED